MAEERAVVAFGKPFFTDQGRGGRVKQHQIRRRTHCQLAGRQAQGAGRASTQACQQRRQVEQAVFYQGHCQRQQHFNAAHARLGRAERSQLGVTLVGLVMAGDGLHHARLHGLTQAVTVGAGAQWRLHMVNAGEIHQRFVSQDQLIQRYIGSDFQAASLGLGDQGHTAGAGQLAEVRAHAALLNQQQVTGQGYGFGGFRNARQTSERCHRAVVSDTALGQITVLGMEDHSQIERGRILQRPAQGAGVGEAVEAVAKCHAARVAQGDQLGQLLAVQAFAQRTDREHLAVAGFTGAVQDQFGDGRGVQHRFGVRRAAQAGDATCRSGAGLAGDGAFAAVARLAQGNVEVNQPGGGHQTLGLDSLRRGETGWRCTDGNDLAGF